MNQTAYHLTAGSCSQQLYKVEGFYRKKVGQRAINKVLLKRIIFGPRYFFFLFLGKEEDRFLSSRPLLSLGDVEGPQ